MHESSWYKVDSKLIYSIFWTNTEKLTPLPFSCMTGNWSLFIYPWAVSPSQAEKEGYTKDYLLQVGRELFSLFCLPVGTKTGSRKGHRENLRLHDRHQVCSSKVIISVNIEGLFMLKKQFNTTLSIYKETAYPLKSLYYDNIRGSDILCAIHWFLLQKEPPSSARPHDAAGQTPSPTAHAPPDVSGPVLLVPFHHQGPG